MPGFKPFAIDGLYPVADGGEGMRRAIHDVFHKVSDAIAGGAKVIILSARHSSSELAPIPSLLLASAVHHHLLREKTQIGRASCREQVCPYGSHSVGAVTL